MKKKQKSFATWYRSRTQDGWTGWRCGRPHSETYTAEAWVIAVQCVEGVRIDDLEMLTLPAGDSPFLPATAIRPKMQVKSTRRTSGAKCPRCKARLVPDGFNPPVCPNCTRWLPAK